MLSEYILPRLPKKYLEQGISQCGAYAAKAILSAFRKDDGRRACDYQISWIGRATVLNRGPATWVKVLRAHGLHAEAGRLVELPVEQWLDRLKEILVGGSPVMIRLGNGYSKRGKWRFFQAAFLGHWITLWGFSDREQVFYVYDPYVPLARHDMTLPAGNVKRSYHELLRDIRIAGFPWWWRGMYIWINK
jgi:hypothetical protein